MPAGELEINLYDAYTKWGVSLEDGALDMLMTLPATKDFITNESRLEDGTRYASQPYKVAQREMALVMHMIALNNGTEGSDKILSALDSFHAELRSGHVNIRTSRQITTVYKCKFVSCTQFSQIDRKIAKFTLKLVEPNPNDRLYTDPSGNLYQNTGIGANAPDDSSE